MHIPDGFLSAPVWASSAALAAGGLALAVKKSQEKFDEKTIPMTGVVCAFIFAAQMINFPVMAGTSGHLLGGVLAAVLLGPWVGALVISLVLIVQCFIFQDGGVSRTRRQHPEHVDSGSGFGLSRISLDLFALVLQNIVFNAAVAIAAWLSVVIASGACALELGLSGTYPTGLAVKAMIFVHSFIGLGEAIITTAVVSSLLASRSDLVALYKTNVNTEPAL